MKKTILRISALLLCVCLLAGCAGAGPGVAVPPQSDAPASTPAEPPADSQGTDSPAAPGPNPQVAQLHIWQADRQQMGFAPFADGFGRQYDLGGQYLFAIGYRSDGSQQLLRAGLDGSDPTALPMPELRPQDAVTQTSIAQLAAGPDDRIWLTEEVIHYEKPGSNAISGFDYYIHCLTADGQPLTVFQLDVPADCPMYNGFDMGVADDGTCYVTADSVLLALRDDGSCRTLPLPPNSRANALCVAGSQVAVLYYNTQTYTRRAMLLDGSVDVLFEGNLLCCDADGNLYMSDDRGLHALAPDGRATLLCDYLNSDIHAFFEAAALYPLSDGRFALVDTIGDGADLQMITLAPADAAAVPVKTLVTVAGSRLDPYFVQQVVNFNRGSDSVRVLLKDYAETGTDQSPAQQLANDVTLGNTPDILLRAWNQELPFDRWAADGLLIDLDPLLDADPALDRDELWPTVLDACRLNGRLTSIVPVFGISTLTAAPDAAGSATAWDWQQFADMLAARPKAQAFDTADKSGFVWSALIRLENRFIDAGSYACDFENQEFITLLEFANTLPEYSELVDTKTLLRTRQALLQDDTVASFEVLRYRADTFGSPVVFKGYPTADGSPGNSFIADMQLGITADSSQPQAAWQFVRYLLCEESQRSWPFGHLPLRRDVCEELIAAAMLPPPLRKGDQPGAAYMRPTTRAEADQVLQLIADTHSLYRDLAGFQAAVQAAVQPYFDGQITAAQAAAAAQAAVTAVLNE